MRTSLRAKGWRQAVCVARVGAVTEGARHASVAGGVVLGVQ